MKKVIGIINDIYVEFDESSINKGCGGSETWIIEISKEFVRQGYYVIVFSYNPIWHFSASGVEYIPINMLEYNLEFQHIDYLLVTRYITGNTLKVLEKNKERFNNNIYHIAHDVMILMDGINDIKNEKINSEYKFYLDNVNKFVCMSNCGIQMLQNLCNIDNDKCVVIGNGLDFSLFDDINNDNKDNNIFWSSRYERNLSLLVDHILPYIQKELPETKIIVAQYENFLPKELLDNENVVFLGKLSKKELYQEMVKHKVWFYPNIYVETFCITVLEEALCDCEIVMPYRNGPADTLAPFKDMLLSENETFDTQESIENAAKIIIDKIKNYDSNKEQRELIKQHIKENYSWENIVKQFTKLFEQN